MDNMERELHKEPARREKKVTGGDAVGRKPELKLSTIYLLGERHYDDEELKSKPTFLINLKHLKAYFKEDESAARVTNADVEAYKAMRRPLTGKKAAKSTVNGELSALSLCFRLAVEKELLDRKYVPVIKFYWIGNTNARKGFFEASDYRRMRPFLKPYLQDCLAWSYVAGSRQGELRPLTWEKNYNEERQEIWFYDTKNDDHRVVSLVNLDGQLNDLGMIIEKRKQARLLNCPWIFHYEGRQMNKFTFCDHWRQAIRASGINLHHHDLRRTAERNLTDEGVDETDRMEIIGHRTSSMAKRYNIRNKRNQQKALSKVSLPSLEIRRPSKNSQNEARAPLEIRVDAATSHNPAELLADSSAHNPPQPHATLIDERNANSSASYNVAGLQENIGAITEPVANDTEELSWLRAELQEARGVVGRLLAFLKRKG